MDSSLNEMNQYLTFTLGGEVFALDIGYVREILDDTNITKIPRTPPSLRGVLNVRGHAVPVVDLRTKFGMSATEMTVNTCVIITEVRIDDDVTQVGALADTVQEVLEIGPEDVDPPPQMGTAIATRFIRGIAKRDNRFIIILDVNRIFSAAELAAAQGGLESAPVESATTSTTTAT